MRKRKLLKRTIIFLFALSLLFSMGVNASYTNQHAISKVDETNFDYLDLWLIVGNQIISERGAAGCPWNLGTHIIDYTPLYNLEDKIIAYHVDLSDGGYMVVNANRQNPVVTEYGYSNISLPSAVETQNYVNESLTNSNSKIYYFGAGLFEREENISSKRKIYGVSGASKSRSQLDASSAALTAVLSTSNQDKAANHAYLRSYVLAHPNLMGDVTDEDYGFVYGGGLPTSTITASDTIYYSTGANYGTTYEFADLVSRIINPVTGQTVIVRNHCVATSAFNMLYYYRRVMGQNIATVDREDVFLDIHFYIGNGPVTPDQYGSRFEDYINNETSYDYIYWLEYANTWQNYKKIISNDRMAFIVSWPTITSAHTYNGIGYREYSTGEQYCRIVDGWNESTDRWYLWDTALYAMGYIEIS